MPRARGSRRRVARLGDLPPRLASAQLELAREQGSPSWPALVHEVAEQPFHTDLDYYEGRADGIATVERRHASPRRGATSRGGTASRAGTSCAAHVEALRERRGAADAVHARLPRGRGRTTASGSRELLDAHPELVRQRGTNGNDLLGMAGDLDDRAAAARARRRPEPRQRLRLDEAPPGRLRERPRARAS